ncbi:TetR/AcrR family transcriptional regulator [Streptomyces longispororuber]|uniref:TetR/AcrR family transcriptional regulator n=1 Tax=Streptomyces longispororuber TaxID=68230 RepID=UPI002109859C|nr:TetR/AcrR family transcriptional regulator [Streptomyces longispororuber]MCQ4210935.1 TetR/AcrR family transcriptional regulator [Streptomyces longispororuber]
MSTRPAGHKAIIEAAREEFSEQGYGATSIRNIAKRAGVSLSALYYYYKGKQELLVAILDDGLDAYFGACDTALQAAGDDPAERLEALVTATVRFRIEHPVKSSIVLTEGRSLEPEHLARYRKNEERGTRQFREVIERGLADGVFLTPYPDDARRTVIAMCNAIAQWYRPDGEVTPDELVERYVSLALTVVEYRPRSVRRAARG